MFRSAIHVFILVLLFQHEKAVAQTSSVLPKDTAFMFQGMPEAHFPGGDKELLKYLKKNIRYPREAFYKGIHGRVIVQFTVDSSGALKDMSVLRGIPGGEALDSEALRVVRTMPRFNPAQQQGKAVSVKYYLPVNFSLSEDIKVIESTPPSYPGGQKAEEDFLSANLIYPAKAKRKKVEGTAIIRVKIGTDGSLLLPKPETLIGYGIEEEALRVVMLMPNWTPEMHDGHAVEKEVRIRVVFKLGQ
jgi:TonB family protein